MTMRSMRTMRERLRLVVAPLVLAALVLAAAGCSFALPEGESGSIPLMPVFNEELGIQGVVLAGCSREDADSHDCSSVTPDEGVLQIVQARIPGSLDDLVGLVMESTALSQLPEASGRYKGSAFTWDLYGFETQLKDVGPVTLRVDLALAEDDAAGYLVAIVTLPDDYESHATWYDTVFTHVVYALAPLEEDV